MSLYSFYMVVLQQLGVAPDDLTGGRIMRETRRDRVLDTTPHLGPRIGVAPFFISYVAESCTRGL